MSKMASSGSISDYEVGTVTATFTGPFSSGQGATVTYVKVQNTVTLSVPQVLAAAAVGTVASAPSNAALPASLRPAAAVVIPVVSTLNNSAKSNTVGKVKIGTDGVITIYKDSLETGTYGTTGSNGWEGFTVSYTVA